VPIDPMAAAIIRHMESAFPAMDLTVSGTEMRRRIAEASGTFGSAKAEPIGEVSDRVVPGPNGDIPVRIYRPETTDISTPVAMFFHGGGWVLCDLDSHDGICRAICNASRCVVVAVDYRLAPEHRFPIGVEDCYAATTWIATHASTLGFDGRRLAVVGDSAGGNLAAAVALMARDRGGPKVHLQVLVYPVIDHSDQTESHRTVGEDCFLKSREVMYYWDQYLAEPEDGSNPYASPLRASTHQRLPATLIITPEFDPLRDEGEDYGRVLIEAGVSTTIHRFPGMFHGFVSFLSQLDAADQAAGEIGAALRSAMT
jgi:acetyl esterase/lipase